MKKIKIKNKKIFFIYKPKPPTTLRLRWTCWRRFILCLTIIFIAGTFSISSYAKLKTDIDHISIKKEFIDYGEYDLSLIYNHKLIYEDYISSPTIAYSKVQQFNNYLLCDNYWDNIKNKIIYIGTKKLESIINKVINYEKKFYKTHFIFYHGQKREFRILQDIYTKLYETFNKTKLKDFFFLRIPNKNFDKFQIIDEFINHYKYKILNNSYPFNIFDNNKNANQHILSVNTSLFGNTLYSLEKYICECTFKYFVRSENITTIAILDLAKEMFSLFNVYWVFNKYKYEIKNLINLLSQEENSKTGNLIQIFIPKIFVNTITYRATPGGSPFYGLDATNHLPTQNILETYPQVLFELSNYGYFNNNKYFNTGTYTELDELQFRILITNEIILNPNSGVKIIRYTTKTENMSLYEKKFKNLLKKMTVDLKKEKMGFIDLISITAKNFFLNF
ncbi:hypothetical protein KAT08_04345 [Candidatus Babeliales bacterium]|nr:hypothetical protein [Candidatus Babeliales bacterium]